MYIRLGVPSAGISWWTVKYPTVSLKIFFFLQDLTLRVQLPHTSHTHEHTDKCTGLLDETNTATLGTSDVTIMAPPFSPHSVGYFLRWNFFLPMDELSVLYPFKC